jgi:putative zinc finger/helix-turn-helix YgiT family protein
MECAVCGGQLSSVIEKRLGHYRDETVEVDSEVMRCAACGEQFFTPAQAKAHNRSVKNEIRKMNGLLPPQKIAQIRNALDLTQEELEELLGTGPKVVVRWESGKVIQSRGHDTMLRLLDRDPGIIESLRQFAQLRHAAQQEYQRPNANPKKMIAQTV